MATLVPGGVRLRQQINDWRPNRDKTTDGWIGDAAHAARASDHNPDAAGWVHAIDIDKDLGGAGDPAGALADALIAYARTGAVGSGRVKYVVFRDRVASGTYPDRFWTWRPGTYGHFDHIHVSFTAEAERNGNPWPLSVWAPAAKPPVAPFVATFVADPVDSTARTSRPQVSSLRYAFDLPNPGHSVWIAGDDLTKAVERWLLTHPYLLLKGCKPRVVNEAFYLSATKPR